jgi:hypothetical protein
MLAQIASAANTIDIPRRTSSNFFFIGQQSDARVAHCDLVLSDWCHSGFFAETRRNLGSFRSEHQVLAAAIASRPHRRQGMPPQTQLGMFFLSYLPSPSLRRNVIIGHQFVNPD